jgi:hypothetical protein
MAVSTRWCLTSICVKVKSDLLSKKNRRHRLSRGAIVSPWHVDNPGLSHATNFSCVFPVRRPRKIGLGWPKFCSARYSLFMTPLTKQFFILIETLQLEPSGDGFGIVRTGDIPSRRIDLGPQSSAFSIDMSWIFIRGRRKRYLFFPLSSNTDARDMWDWCPRLWSVELDGLTIASPRSGVFQFLIVLV